MTLLASWPTITATFMQGLLIGLFSSVHCIGMCGGLAASLSLAIPRETNRVTRMSYLSLFSIGRITQYLVIVSCFFFILHFFQKAVPAFSGEIARTIAGLMLIAIGLYIGQWWVGLKKIEVAFAPLWQRVSPLLQSLMPINSKIRAFGVGFLWGALPCGLVFSSALWAGNEPSLSLALVGMLGFGCGTLPAVMMSGAFASELAQLLHHRAFRSIGAIALIIFGLWTLISPWWMFFMHQGHHGHMHHHTCMGFFSDTFV
jgi:uncharacterized protein